MITYAEVLAKIVATLTGRPPGTEIEPEDHEDTEIMILDYIEQLKTAVQAAIVGNLILTGSPASNLSATGVKIILTAGANFAFGDIGYIKSDGTLGLPKADAIATASALFMCADATIVSAASGNWLVLGIARNDAWNWTPGQTIFLSTGGTTANTLVQVAPSGTDHVIQKIGMATHANRMFFKPELAQVEHT